MFIFYNNTECKLNGETEGVGFTVTITVNVLPIQFPETADTR